VMIRHGTRAYFRFFTTKDRTRRERKLDELFFVDGQAVRKA